MRTLFKRTAATSAAFIAIGGATVLPAAAADAATTHPAVSQSHHWCGWRWDTCCYGGDWGGGWWHHRWCRPFFEHHGFGGGFDHGGFDHRGGDHGGFDHGGFDHRGGDHRGGDHRGGGG
jgi:hypothetical protein